jgi:cytochrome c553
MKNMRRHLWLFIALLSTFALLACGGNDSASQEGTGTSSGISAGSTNSNVSGSAVKGPIEGAEIRLFYFDSGGTETEIVAENAPVLTSSSGAFDLQVNYQHLEGIQSPLILKSSGGTMGGQPAPELETIISDASLLASPGQALTRHMSTASTVAARLLEYRAQAAGTSLQPSDAQDCIAKVEGALEVDLDQDPGDATQGVAMVNMNVDENLDLFNTPQNNHAVPEYIEYLARNLNSTSGMLDDKMENPDHPGEDIDADFNRFGDGDLARLFPQGPSRLHSLMMKVDKAAIAGDGVDTATIDIKLTNGWHQWGQDDAQIDLAITAGEGQLSDTQPTTLHGRARVTFTSTTPGDVVIQASYALDNGNTIIQEIRLQVADSGVNDAPIASAGSDRTITTGTAVTLDGSQSSDMNNDPLTYAWVLTSPGGSAATLSDPTIFNPVFTADVDGTYIAELVVNDGMQDSPPSRVTITAVSGNTAPTAHAGPDQNVTTGAVVALDGSGSRDPDDNPLTYLWSLLSMPAGSNATLTNATQSAPSFTADVDGTYVVQLVVNDGSVDSAPVTVKIIAASSNSTPIADAGTVQNVATGSVVDLDGSGSQDADNDPLTYLWTMVSRPAGSSAALSEATLVNPSFSADVDGTYVIELVVNDGKVDSLPATVSIVASTANSAPIANAGPDQSVNAGTTVSLDGSSSHDADNDALTYAWTLVSKPAGSATVLPDSATSYLVFITPDVAGTYVVQLVVNDGTVDSTPDTMTITATATGPDGAALFSTFCAGCHGADGTQIKNLRGISAAAIEAKMPHQGITINDIGGSAGAQAVAGFLGQ